MIFKYDKPLFCSHTVYYSEKGTRTVPTYVIDFPDSGGVCLRKTGEKPLYELIQANLVNCDLKSVIESCVHSNQYAVCTPDNLHSLVADFSSLSNLGELYAGTKRMESTWNELPLEVREQFGSDIRSFIRSIGTDDFYEKVDTGYDSFYKTIMKNMNPDVVPPVLDVKVPEVNVPDVNVPEVNVPEVKVGE